MKPTIKLSDHEKAWAETEARQSEYKNESAWNYVEEQNEE